MQYPKKFLDALIKEHYQTKLVKIIKMTWDEIPMEEIQGNATAGSLNIDGSSAVRTTGSLNLIVKNLDLTGYNIALGSKIKIDIGIENYINSQYPEIIWIPQGIFIVTSFNTSINTTGATISLNFKDKMCLLNGEIGGTLAATTNFSQVDDYSFNYEFISDDFNYQIGKYYYWDETEKKFMIDMNARQNNTRKYYRKTNNKITSELSIKEIIQNIVHVYGGESLGHIIIKDLDLQGLELLEYRGNSPLYLLHSNDQFIDLTYNSDTLLDKKYYVGVNLTAETYKPNTYYCKKIDNDSGQYIFELVNSSSFSETTQYYMILDNITALENWSTQNETSFVRGEFYTEENPSNILPCPIIKLNYGDLMGYHGTELVYAGTLIANVGESLVSVLDKIKNMLSNFEYFYDSDGNFVFQAKHDYQEVNHSAISTLEDGEILIDTSMYNNAISHTFNDTETFTQIAHTPNLTNVYNDYSIWGQRTGISGAKIPIHLRYAFQKKPVSYTPIRQTERTDKKIVIYKASSLEDKPYFTEFYNLQKNKGNSVDNIQDFINNSNKAWDNFTNETRQQIWDKYQKIINDIEIQVNNYINIINTYLSKNKDMGLKQTTRGQASIEKIQNLKELAINFIKNLRSSHLEDFFKNCYYIKNEKDTTQESNISTYLSKIEEFLFFQTSQNEESEEQNIDRCNITGKDFSNINQQYKGTVETDFNKSCGYLWDEFFNNEAVQSFKNVSEEEEYQSSKWFYLRNTPQELKSIYNWEEIYIPFKEELLSDQILDISAYFEELLTQVKKRDTAMLTPIYSNENTEEIVTYTIGLKKVSQSEKPDKTKTYYYLKNSHYIEQRIEGNSFPQGIQYYTEDIRSLGYPLKIKQAYLGVIINLFIEFWEFFFRIDGGFEFEKNGEEEISNNYAETILDNGEKKYIRKYDFDLSVWGTLNSYNNTKDTYFAKKNSYRAKQQFSDQFLYNGSKTNSGDFNKLNGLLAQPEYTFKAITPAMFYDLTAQDEFSGAFILDMCTKILSAPQAQSVINVLLEGARKGFVKVSAKLPGNIYIFKNYTEFRSTLNRCLHGVELSDETSTHKQFSFASLSDFNSGMMSLRGFIEIICLVSENYQWAIELTENNIISDGKTYAGLIKEKLYRSNPAIKPLGSGTTSSTKINIESSGDVIVPKVTTNSGTTTYYYDDDDILHVSYNSGYRSTTINTPNITITEDNTTIKTVEVEAEDVEIGQQSLSLSELTVPEHSTETIQIVAQIAEETIVGFFSYIFGKIDNNTAASFVTPVNDSLWIDTFNEYRRLWTYAEDRDLYQNTILLDEDLDKAPMTIRTNAVITRFEDENGNNWLDLEEPEEEPAILKYEIKERHLFNLDDYDRLAPYTTDITRHIWKNYFLIYYPYQEIENPDISDNDKVSRWSQYWSATYFCYDQDIDPNIPRPEWQSPIWRGIIYDDRSPIDYSKPLSDPANNNTSRTSGKWIFEVSRTYRDSNYQNIYAPREIGWNSIFKKRKAENSNSENDNKLVQLKNLQDMIKGNTYDNDYLIDTRKVYFWPEYMYISRNKVETIYHNRKEPEAMRNILYYTNRLNCLTNVKLHMALDGTAESLKCAALIQKDPIYNKNKLISPAKYDLSNRISLLSYNSKFNPDTPYCYYIKTLSRPFASDKLNETQRKAGFSFVKTSTADLSDIQLLLFIREVAKKRGITRLLEGEIYGWEWQDGGSITYKPNQFFYFNSDTGAYEICKATSGQQPGDLFSFNPFPNDPKDSTNFEYRNIINQKLYIDRLGSYGDLLDITINRDFVGAAYTNNNQEQRIWKRYAQSIKDLLKNYYDYDYKSDEAFAAMDISGFFTQACFNNEPRATYLKQIALIDTQLIYNYHFERIKHDKEQAQKIAEYENTKGYNYIDNFNNLWDEIFDKVDKYCIIEVDWRELIYKMAIDYFNYGSKDFYLEELIEANPFLAGTGGITGYEPFYTDILGFWRQLYFNPILESVYYDIEDEAYNLESYDSTTGWNKQVLNAPESINFWFDLSEGFGILRNYGIDKIGDRLKATNDSKIGSIDYKTAPTIIYYNAQDEIKRVENDNLGSYSFLQLGGPIQNVASISNKSKTAIQLLQEQLYKYAYCVETLTITTIPLYTLEPNTRIFINSVINGLTGEYIITKLTQPLTYNGTMQITAIKAVPYLGIINT